MATENSSQVKTTETSLEILDYLFDTGDARLDEIGAALNLSSSTVHRHLQVLRKFQYVVKEGERYRLGLQFLTVGGHLRRKMPGYQTFKEKVDQLAKETGDRAQFMTREGTERIYIYTETGESSVQTGAFLGRRGPIHASAAGKAILANLPENTRERLINSLEMERTATNTIANKDVLRENLEAIRKKGYAINREESAGGVHAVGAPVRGKHGEVIGALSVSGPASRLKEERLSEDLPDLILAATNEIELQIKHSYS